MATIHPALSEEDRQRFAEPAQRRGMTWRRGCSMGFNVRSRIGLTFSLDC